MSKSSLQSIWSDIVNLYSPARIEFIGTILVQLLFFWLPSLFYFILPTIVPSFSERHKLQPAPKQPTSTEIRHCFALVLRNQVMSISLHFLLLSLSTFFHQSPSLRISSSLPASLELLCDLTISAFLREALFYYSHRLLHSAFLYRRIHKTHHYFTAPMALAAQYAHPIEHLVANILPIQLPPMLLHSHIVTFWVFLALELLETTTVHSGYDFLYGAARKHDVHHERFVVNFGALGVLDWIHGTGEESRVKREGKGKEAERKSRLNKDS